jgi:hypothetical protein
VIYDPDRLSAKDAALIAARELGCTCAADITVSDGVAWILHDWYCALARREDVN